MDLEEQAADVIDRCNHAATDIISCVDVRYPSSLLHLASPPPLLYVRGMLPSRSSIAVVGTRAHTIQYGQPVTEYVVREWTRAGCAIVSGLAQGIDTIAHETCVRHGGCTVAVIASGTDRITPRTAQDLSTRIIDTGGCIVSEHACGVKAYAPAFPARNRIIAALSSVVVVIESKARGGALITAQMACDIGVPVYAVPGPITSSRSVGCNTLIRDGHARALVHHLDVASHVTLATSRSDVCDAGWQPCDTASAKGIDEIAHQWSCTIAEARTRLGLLELDGTVTVLPGGLYVIPE